MKFDYIRSDGKTFTQDTTAAYWFGVRDARLGHAEGRPIHPYTSDELAAYRQGYSDQRTTDAMK